MNNLDLSLESILGNWIPLGFGLIGIFMLLVGVLNMVSGKDKAFNNIFGGLFVILVAVGLAWLMREIVIPTLL